MGEYAPGKGIFFPHTGNTYVITAVDEDTRTVTFAHPSDLVDYTTEAMDDLANVDVEVW